MRARYEIGDKHLQHQSQPLQRLSCQPVRSPPAYQGVKGVRTILTAVLVCRTVFHCT